MIDWLVCAAVKLVGGVLCLLPPAAAVWIGERLGGLAAWLQPKRTRIGILNLRAAFDGQLTPEQARRTIYACYRQMGAGFVELLRLPVIDHAYKDRYITVDGHHHLQEATASGRPLILLTAHYGNWELSSIVSALLGHPIVALARAQEKFPRLYRLLVSYRESKGCAIIHKGRAMRQLLTALSRGRPVGIVADQASRHGVFMGFFGRPALFARGPFELAHREGATILPVFTHRVRGPSHRVVVEPPLTLPQDADRERTVLEGARQFADHLERHIRQDPTQWLWMHKRWKYTPARRVLILSDGKPGHLKQSLAVVDALRERRPELAHQVVEVRYRHRLARAAALLWSWWLPRGWGAIWCLRRTLTPSSASALLSRYADLIVSCGSSLTAVNALWSFEQRAKSVVLMNPAPLPLRRFDLVVAPRHDRLPRQSNVVEIDGAMAGRLGEETLREAGMRLKTYPRFRAGGANTSQPVVAVLIGGSTPTHQLTVAVVQAMLQHVLDACEGFDGACLVTTSRRTPPEVERWLTEHVETHPRCRLLVLAGRDPLDGTLTGMLGLARIVVVTSDSVSMLSEACASGRSVLAVELPRALGRFVPTKHDRFLQQLANTGSARCVTADDLGAAIHDVMKHGAVSPRLDQAATVGEAVAKLL